MSEYMPSKELTTKNDAYEQLDSDYKKAWGEFMEKHKIELESLETKREARNMALIDAQKCGRDEILGLDIKTHKNIRYGSFSVVRKQKEWFDSEKVLEISKAIGQYSMLKDRGIIIERTEVAPYKEIRPFLERHMIKASDGQEFPLLRYFEQAFHCEDETPAVTGPKAVPAFGIEYKGK